MKQILIVFRMLMSEDWLKLICEKLLGMVIEIVAGIISKWKKEKARLQAVESDLQQLDGTRKRIVALLNDAEERRYIEDDSIHRWLRDLKNVAFDTEDVYDEFQTHKILAEIPISRRGKRLRVFDGRDFADRIQKIRSEYDRIVKEKNDLRLLRKEAVRISNPQSRRDRHQEGSLQDDERFHGRQEETKEIVAKLLNFTCRDNVQVISIVGSCGSGKTSLARNIFKVAGLEQEIVDGCSKNHFDLRIWVYLSQNFDLVRTIREVIKAVKRKECHDSTLDLLQFDLKNIISGKRFLLVLDNMWREEFDFWENLRIPLMDGAQGSKILVTTQNESVANKMQTVHKLYLEGLSEDDGWLLFQDVAFSAYERTTVLRDYPDLESYGKDIVKECQGYPLAIKAIGTLLHSEKDVMQWEQLSKELMENEKVVAGIIPLLKTSYDHLPLHLKHCFAFCSTFPKDYEFGKDEMVKLWMAAKLVEIEDNERRKIEVVAGRYFDDLLGRSFFQASDSNMKCERKYKMPTVIHDLAHQLLRNESLRINQDVAEHGKSRMARYELVYHHDKQPVTFNKMFENKGLRALILYGKNGLLGKEALVDLFEKLRFLRLLDLSSSCLEELPDSVCNLILLRYLSLHGTNITKLPGTVGNLQNLQTLELGNCHQIQELPDSIGNLKSLRNLGLHNTSIRRLPESVSHLLNLQTLELGDCYKLEKLPESMKELKNLRHLSLQLDWDEWDRQTDLISMPPSIGSLKSLRHLSRFAVGSERHHGLAELKDLKLRGDLCITKLEKVVDVCDAEAANLRDKGYLDSLMLRWSEAPSTKSELVIDEHVIDRLQPHKKLQHLRVENYSGNKFPNWMGDPSFLKLETLKLINCKMCQSLPCVWKLPSLKTLQIKGLHQMKYFETVRSGFELLETLDVSDMPDLELWFTIVEGQMSCLSSLNISNCPKLRRLPYLPPSIRKFELRNCQKLPVLDKLPNLQDLVLESDSGQRLEWVQRLTSLTSLTLSNISAILDDHTGIFNHLTSLKQLKVQKCNDLDSIDGLTNHPSLEYLEISSCPILSRIDLPEKLKRFVLHNCRSLHALPDELHRLSSLCVIEIQSVSLAAMPILPAGVKKLVIKECSLLSKRCQQGGDDWSKIKHIPYILVNKIEYHDGQQPYSPFQAFTWRNWLLPWRGGSSEEP